MCGEAGDDERARRGGGACRRLVELFWLDGGGEATEFDFVAKIDPINPLSKVALIISLYLGAGTEGANSRARRAVAGMAALCPSLRKETLTFLTSHPDVVLQAEGFLKKVLRHYKVTNPSPVVKTLLACRARLYYRVGRLLQSWPTNQHETSKALAKIESQYSAEMVDSRAISAGIPVLFAMPQTVQTVADTDRPRKVARIAAGSNGDILSASGLASGALSPGDTVADDERALHMPEEIPTELCDVIPSVPLNNHADELMHRIAMQCMLHALVIEHASVERVEVMVAPTTEPVVWQVRAKQTLKAGALMLIPYVSNLSPVGNVKRPSPGPQ